MGYKKEKVGLCVTTSQTFTTTTPYLSARFGYQGSELFVLCNANIQVEPGVCVIRMPSIDGFLQQYESRLHVGCVDWFSSAGAQRKEQKPPRRAGFILLGKWTTYQKETISRSPIDITFFRLASSQRNRGMSEPIQFDRSSGDFLPACLHRVIVIAEALNFILLEPWWKLFLLCILPHTPPCYLLFLNCRTRGGGHLDTCDAKLPGSVMVFWSSKKSFLDYKRGSRR